MIAKNLWALSVFEGRIGEAMLHGADKTMEDGTKVNIRTCLALAQCRNRLDI